MFAAYKFYLAIPTPLRFPDMATLPPSAHNVVDSAWMPVGASVVLHRTRCIEYYITERTVGIDALSNLESDRTDQVSKLLRLLTDSRRGSICFGITCPRVHELAQIPSFRSSSSSTSLPCMDVSSTLYAVTSTTTCDCQLVIRVRSWSV